MTQIPSDEILEGLYKSRVRESEKLKTVLELYNMEIHQKKAGPDYHRLKTMVKKKYRAEFTNDEFWSRKRNYETNAVVKNQGTKQREQRSLGDCWHDMNKRAKSTQPNPSPRSSTRQNEKMHREPEVLEAALKWKSVSTAVQGLPSRNLHQSILWKMASPECLFCMSENGYRYGEKVLSCASPGWWTA